MSDEGETMWRRSVEGQVAMLEYLLDDKDLSLQWDGSSNRGAQRDGGHPCHLNGKIRKICVCEWE